MKASVLKFYIWIPYEKIADLYIFPCLSYLPFRSYYPFKISTGQEVSKEVLELEVWAADRG